jgi:MarR family transcriptional regulator, organic hydroperoxide resistance regulator
MVVPALLAELGELRVRSGHLQHLREFGSRRSGLTARERLALDVLAEQSPLTMGGLANLCSCTKSTMTAVVDRLVRGGYVERESLEWDRRSVYVRITATGREVAQEHRQLHFDEARGMLSQLSPDEQELLVRAYRGLVAHLEALVDREEAERPS